MNLIPKRKYTGTPAVQESTIQETIGRIGSLEVDSLAADKITAGNLAADVIATCNLNATQITAGDIATNRLTANAANAVNDGSITISAAKINISGDCTFSTGYDPTGKIATGGAAADVNSGVTTISGGKITTGTLSADAITTSSLTSKKITLAIAAGTGDVAIQAGKTDFTNTDSGFILGLDDSDGDKAKFFIGSSTAYLNWTGTALNIAGASMTAGNVTIDSEGIWINNTATALIFKESSSEVGSIYFSAVTHGLYIETSVLNKHINISSGGYLYLYAYNSISMTSNLGLDLPKLAIAPTPVEGRMYYDTTYHMPMCYAGTGGSAFWYQMIVT